MTSTIFYSAFYNPMQQGDFKQFVFIVRAASNPASRLPPYLHMAAAGCIASGLQGRHQLVPAAAPHNSHTTVTWRGFDVSKRGQNA
jgi:hypothetical protein